MIDPSGLRLPDDAEFRVEKIENGLYSVVNAYDGEYEYFDERPIQKRIGFAPSGPLESELDVSPISVKI
jgi:hypothetical protein